MTPTDGNWQFTITIGFIICILLLVAPGSAITGTTTSADTYWITDSSASWSENAYQEQYVSLNDDDLNFQIISNDAHSLYLDLEKTTVFDVDNYKGFALSIYLNGPMASISSAQSYSGSYSFLTQIGASGTGYIDRNCDLAGQTTLGFWAYCYSSSGTKQIQIRFGASSPAYVYETFQNQVWEYHTITIPEAKRTNKMYVSISPRSGVSTGGYVYVDDISFSSSQFLNLESDYGISRGGGDTYEILNSINSEISVSGQFCLGHTLNFTLHDLNDENKFGLYTISGFYEMTQPSEWTEIDLLYGPKYYSRSLAPGNWSVHGTIQSGSVSDDAWINFTIVNDCLTAFNGTINSTSMPYDPWDPNNPTTWNWTTPFTPYQPDPVGVNDTYIKYLYDHGYINESEWNNYVEYYNLMFNASQAQYANSTLNATAQDLTGIIQELNKAGQSSRSNLNTSTTILQSALTPPFLAVIGYGFDMIPPVFIDLMGAMLGLSCCMLLLKSRGNK
jgi:hypothetical protein